ncbi:MAG: DUF4131 domain-containing protein, partial [Anaerolineales bacterium]
MMPLVWVAVTCAIGILLAAWLAQAAWLALPAWAWLIPAGLGVLLSLLARRVSVQSLFQRFRGSPARVLRAVPVWVLLLSFSAGMLRMQMSLPELSPEALAWYNDRSGSMIVQGVVNAPPDRRDTYVNLRIQVASLQTDEESPPQPVDGLLLAAITAPGQWAYGDEVRLVGRLETPPEGETFSYREYLARHKIYSVMRTADIQVMAQGQGNPLLAVLYGLRAQALETIYTLWPDPEASLLAGILLGVESGIPRQVQAAFIATGTSHIIAISGFNNPVTQIDLLLNHQGLPQLLLAGGN